LARLSRRLLPVWLYPPSAIDVLHWLPFENILSLRPSFANNYVISVGAGFIVEISPGDGSRNFSDISTTHV